MKDTAVKAMFETIAPAYDFQNSFLSLGLDIYWRRALAAAVKPAPGSTVLDVAVGTAETALAISRRHPLVKVLGVDFSPAMLAVGRQKLAARRRPAPIRLTAGDGRRLPVRGASVSAVTISFGIRNVEERQQVLAEFYRVLQAGGRLLIMEFSYPEAPLLAGLYRLYFHHILPPLGNWLSRTDYAYSYLAESVRAFPAERRFSAELAAAGFSNITVTKLSFGIVKIFQADKGGR